MTSLPATTNHDGRGFVCNDIKVGSEKKKRSLVTALCVVTLFFVGAVWTCIKTLTSTNFVEAECFAALTLQGLYFGLAILLRHLRRPVYVFEPYTMVTLVYALVYHVAPIFQFSVGDTARYGVDAMPQTFQAVLLVVAGHIAFTLAYGSRPTKEKNVEHVPFYHEPGDKALVVKISYVIFFVAFVLYVFYKMSCGFSLSYILSGGFAGTQNLTIEDSSLSFLSYMIYTCVGAWAVCFAYGANKLLKVVTYGILIAVLFFSGTRAAILLPLLVPVVISYIRKDRTPSLAAFGGAIGLLVLLFAVMQVARVGIRSGAGMDLGTGGLASLFEPFYTEIDDFKAFYSLLGIFPDHNDYLFGSQMILGSLTLFIPRAIWPGKPDPQVHDIVNAMYGYRAVLDGVAYPNLGEYYVEFGIVGIITGMFILGFLCRYARRLFVKREGLSLSLVMYSLIYGALFQIIIRGYMPQNFSLMVFLLAPVVLVAVVAKRTSHPLER